MTDDDMAWDGAPGAPQLLEDAGPWTWYLSETWQHAAAPELFAGPSRRPGDGFSSAEQVSQAHGPWIAYLAPLLHLTTFGLGWRIPELGLWRWLQMGMPTEDPVLSTIAARYRPADLELVTTWLSRSGGDLLRYAAFREDSSERQGPAELVRLAERTRTRPEYRALFEGGGDPLHLSMHLEWSAQGEKPRPLRARTVLRGEPVDYLLVGEQYRTLMAALHTGAAPPVTDGRSTRVGVICPPIGWLGNYRRSRATGRWFRGRHRWHELGS